MGYCSRPTLLCMWFKIARAETNTNTRSVVVHFSGSYSLRKFGIKYLLI